MPSKSSAKGSTTLRGSGSSKQESFGDLFAEQNLWQIFRQSRPFYHRSPFNRYAAILAGIVLVGFAITSLAESHMAPATSLDFSELFTTWAKTGVSYAATILGFLLAGFAVLFAVLRPHTVLALRNIVRPGEQLTELKLIFVTFVNVFVHYTAFVGWCIIYLVAGGRGGPFDVTGRHVAQFLPWIRPVVMHVVFVAWGFWFLLLVLKLKSFIYNLYQTLLLGMAADAIE